MQSEAPRERRNDTQLLELTKKMNGISDKAMKEADKIQVIELVLEDLGSMAFINRFKGLKSLTLVNCGIVAIEGLDYLARLEELWLNENLISEMKGLKNLKSLRSLFMCHNQVRQIAGLEGLTQLETLWLCDNRIDVIEGLQSLHQLKQLWLAGNQIEQIRTSLDGLVSLTDLNISGNRVCSFKETLNLNRLPNLRIIAFYDPHFSENPICNLCNYQTYVLYHLRNVVRLDTVNIEPRVKQTTQNTFLRKTMFYNMRIKTIKRTISTLVKLIQKASLIKFDSLNDDMAALRLKLEELGDNPELSQLHEATLQALLHLPRLKKNFKRMLYSVEKTSIRKQLTELETGGNIKLEEGRPSEKWYASCVDLIRTRFLPGELASLGITDFSVRRLIRIHNKFLKNKFEERMESLSDMSSIKKKGLEYLFYGIDPRSPYEIETIMEEGFRSVKEAKSLGLPPYTALVNSLVPADLPRLLAFRSKKQNQEKFQGAHLRKVVNGSMVYPPGMILVCKVYMQKNVSDPKYPYFSPEKSATEIQTNEPVTFEGDEDALFRVHLNQSRNRIYFLRDNYLIQPQYLVEFDYQMDNLKQNRIFDCGDQAAVLDDDDFFITANNRDRLADDLPRIYDRIVEDVNSYNFQNLEDYANQNLRLRGEDLDKLDLGMVKVPVVNYLKYSLSKSKLYQLNPCLLLENDMEVDLAKVENLKDSRFLNLSNSSKVKNLSLVGACQGLTTLVLSYSRITSLVGFVLPPALVKLDLGHNQLADLQGMSPLPLMQSLDLSHNDLSSTTQLKPLLVMGVLHWLNLSFNPLALDRQTPERILAMLPSLKTLDHQSVAQLLKSTQQQEAEAVVTQALARQQGRATLSKMLQVESDWRLSVQSLNLAHCRLKSMKGLHDFPNLRSLNVSHNQIERIQDVRGCKLLDEINIEKNRVGSLEGLQTLLYLKKVEAGKNRIARLGGLGGLAELSQLSVEDNQISSLQEFGSLGALMELYIANNLIADTREIKCLKDLPKLIIFDLSGNPLSRDPSYKSYTLYHLKFLKVLDGQAIDKRETEEARDFYSGRLTDEILKERLGDKRPEDIRELDLEDQKLKDFEEVFTVSCFPNLEILRLNKNIFTCTKMLGHLPKLRELHLADNRIESLFYSSDMSVKKGLNGCPLLELLELGGNQLKEFNGLQFCNLRELRKLFAEGNQIVRVDNLENLRQLTQLRLSRNKIKQLEATSFNGCNPIKVLYLSDNGLKNFGHIQRLLKLHTLFAGSNRINELSDVERLSELGCLRELDLQGNSLSRKPGYRQAVLQKLDKLVVLDGREVSQEERERIVQMSSLDRALPNMYIPQISQRVIPMRLGSVNFEGVFPSNGNRFNIDIITAQNMPSLLNPPKK